MAKLSSWFAVLRWALILTLILVICLTLAPIFFPRKFARNDTTDEKYRVNCVVMFALALFGLFSVGCYYFYLTFIFGITLVAYLIVEFVYLNLGNIGTWLTLIGLIICSFTYCAAMRRLRNEALYGA